MTVVVCLPYTSNGGQSVIARVRPRLKSNYGLDLWSTEDLSEDDLMRFSPFKLEVASRDSQATAVA